MITNVVRLCWLGLVRDRIALALTFVLPILFFSIFALVFGGAAGSPSKRVKIAVVDEQQSTTSQRVVRALQADPGLSVTLTTRDSPPRTLDRATAEALVRGGKLPVAVIIPPEFSFSFAGMVGDSETSAAPVLILADQADPIASQMTAGLLQRAAMTAGPDLLMEQGVALFDKYAGGLTDQQRATINLLQPALRALADPDRSAAVAPASQPEAAAAPAAMSGLIPVKVVDLLGKRDKTPMIAFYAAGTAVMFLLFSVSGAGGSLLEDAESGALERLLTSRLSMSQLLAGKWLFATLLGMMQVTIMFLWGAAVFGLRLFTIPHLNGFAVMTLFTAASAAALGLVLATACRTYAQLSGVSTILILIMSAVGGSMFPRFLMPETMQKFGLITFNAWALDGYQKVFWYDRPFTELWPQVLVLTALTFVFLLAARQLARRWETV